MLTKAAVTLLITASHALLTQSIPTLLALLQYSGSHLAWCVSTAMAASSSGGGGGKGGPSEGMVNLCMAYEQRTLEALTKPFILPVTIVTGFLGVRAVNTCVCVR